MTAATWNPTLADGSVPLVEAIPHPSMECFQGAFTPLPWRRQGLHPRDLANSWLVEYCNNGPRFGRTLEPGGSLLSQLDSQADWTLPELAGPGAFNDMDMQEICHPEWTMPDGRPDIEGWKSQFALWALLASPIILGNDIRSMSQECVEIVSNEEILSVSQDEAVKPYRMLWQSLPRLTYRQDDVQQIFARTMADGDQAVVFFNRYNQTRNISLHWEQLGVLPPHRACRIRDLDSRTVLAPHQIYRLTLPTPAHGVRVLRFTCSSAGGRAAVVPARPPPLPPPPAIAPPPPPWNPPPTMMYSLEVQPCSGGGASTGNASLQQFIWRPTDHTLRLTSQTDLCVTYLGQSMSNVGLATCVKPWVEVGVGSQTWTLSNATAGGEPAFVWNDCQPGGKPDIVRCFNVVQCNVTAPHAFEVGDSCALHGACDQRWAFSEDGKVRSGVDGFRSCLTLAPGGPK